MTNTEILAKLIASDSKVVVSYEYGQGESDTTEPLSAKVAAPMVAQLERLGATVRIARFEG